MCSFTSDILEFVNDFGDERAKGRPLMMRRDFGNLEPMFSESSELLETMDSTVQDCTDCNQERKKL